MDPRENSTEAERRSTRIRAQIPLRVTSLDAATPFTESGGIVIGSTGAGRRHD